MTLIACGDTTDPTPVVASIGLQPTTADLITGDTRQLTATPFDGDGNAVPGRSIIWATTAPTVVMVSGTGLVTAVGPGQAVITARIDDVVASVVITVVSRAASVQVITDLTTLDIFTDQAFLAATVRDAAGNVLDGWPVSWSSADPGIAEVSSTGVVTPVGVGSTDVSARSDGRVGHTTITVIRLPAEVVSVSPSTVSMLANSELQLTPTVQGPGGKVLLGRLIDWSSSNLVVASVNQAGLVTSHSAGDATITVAVEGHVAQVLLKVFGSVTFSSATSGGGHTCSRSGQRVFCWGENIFGQLGSVGDTCDGGFYYDDYPCALTPKAVGGGMTFVELAAGGTHTCGLSSIGQAHCWGSGEFGELGRGSLDRSIAPVAVLGGLSFLSISAGYNFTCGVTFLAEAYCWGDNSQGQVGDGTTTNRKVPVAVVGGLSFRVLRTGGGHTCGITTGARLYCWGSNGLGQLGDGSLVYRSAPVAVAGNLSVSAVAAGAAHTCAITMTGEAYCWGNNPEGALGNGGTVSSPIPVAVAGGIRWIAITAGVGFTCGIATDDGAYCWGENSSGQLGNASLVRRRTPVPVSGALTFGSLSAGGYHACGRTTAGALFCWGAGWSGQLGDGGRDTRIIPTRVLGQP